MTGKMKINDMSDLGIMRICFSCYTDALCFDQCLGARQSKHWLKSAFFTCLHFWQDFDANITKNEAKMSIFGGLFPYTVKHKNAIKT